MNSFWIEGGKFSQFFASLKIGRNEEDRETRAQELTRRVYRWNLDLVKDNENATKSTHFSQLELISSSLLLRSNLEKFSKILELERKQIFIDTTDFLEAVLHEAIMSTPVITIIRGHTAPDTFRKISNNYP